MHRSRRATLAALALALVAFGGVAYAQPEEEAAEEGAPAEADAAPVEEEAPDPRVAEAQDRLDRATQLFEDENYDAALAEFSETLELLGEHEMRFVVLYNIGKTHERLFRYDEAMRAYQLFLTEGGAETALAGEVRAKIELLEGLLGTIVIQANVEQYVVWIDDREIGENLDRVSVPGGSHVVELRAPGYQPDRRDVQVPARAEREAVFELEELAEEYEGIGPGLFWAGVSLTAVTLLGGAALGIVALGQHNDLQSQIDDDPYGGIGSVEQSEIDSMLNLALGADILFGSALLLGTATIIIALFTNFGGDEAEEEPAARLQLAPSVSSQSGGFQLLGSF